MDYSNIDEQRWVTIHQTEYNRLQNGADSNYEKLKKEFEDYKKGAEEIKLLKENIIETVENHFEAINSGEKEIVVNQGLELDYLNRFEDRCSVYVRNNKELERLQKENQNLRESNQYLIQQVKKLSKVENEYLDLKMRMKQIPNWIKQIF